MTKEEIIKEWNKTEEYNGYVIINIESKEFFTTEENKVKIFKSRYDALIHCGIYELQNVWVCCLDYYYND